MKLTIKIEYEQRLLDIVEEELESYVDSLRRRAEAEGLQVDPRTAGARSSRFDDEFAVLLPEREFGD